jgi:D-lactate dehydrogenase
VLYTCLYSLQQQTADDDKKIAISYTTDTLSADTASNAAGHDILCLFVNDTADQQALKSLSNMGIKMIAMRCAGYDRVDTDAAETLGLTVARVPAYSPYAVAEHAITLLMTLNRNIHK